MRPLTKYFTKSAGPWQPVQERTQAPSIKEKIRAFNSIVSILAQIQQGPPFQDYEMPNKNPPNRDERLQLKLSNAFAHLAITTNEVVAATLYTPEKLTIMTWMQDHNSGYQDEPEAAQDTQKESESKPKSTVWDKICWLFACNTANTDMRPGSNYQGPCIVKPTPPKDYSKRSDSKEALLQYLDDFPNKW